MASGGDNTVGCDHGSFAHPCVCTAAALVVRVVDIRGAVRNLSSLQKWIEFWE